MDVFVASASDSSATFWAEAGVVVALVVGIVSVGIAWIALKVASQKLRLYYAMSAVAPLLTTPVDMRSDLELFHNGILLEDPRVVTIELVSRSRGDIANKEYNDGQPLILNINAKIVKVLGEPSGRGPGSILAVNPDNKVLKIGPSLIHGRDQVTITVLTDGDEPFLTLQDSLLINVDVKPRADNDLDIPEITWNAPWATWAVYSGPVWVTTIVNLLIPAVIVAIVVFIVVQVIYQSK